MNTVACGYDEMLEFVTGAWRRRVLLGGLLLIAMVGSVSTWAQPVVGAGGCARLMKLEVPEATITMAEVVEPLGFKLPNTGRGPGNGGPGSGGPNMALAPFDPKDTTNHVAFCRVAATLRPSGDSDIKVEVWLPVEGWNGKLMGAGNFGGAASIMYGGLLIGLEHGFAVASTDAGRGGVGSDEFALGHPDKLIDAGYRAAHGMTVDAKLVVKAFYGRAAKHAYFFGCSLGGQMGLTEVQRFPEDYDGAIVGAPASPVVDLHADQIWPSLLLVEKPERQLGRAKAAMLHAAVMDACDGLDGVKDGELENPMACHFDAATLLCKGGDNDRCLTAAQVEFVKMLYAGPVSRKTGAKLFEGAAPGTELSFADYTPDHAMGIAVGHFKYMVFQDANWDWKTLDMDRDVAYGRAVLRGVNLSDNPNLKPFFARGGKLLWYHGWMDGSNPMVSVDYLNAVKKTVGVAETENSMRLFAVPGMGHCNGGAGCDVFDKLAVLDAWVESGVAPNRIVASKVVDGKVVRTHPLCAYPEAAHYDGSGDVKNAASFVCGKP